MAKKLWGGLVIGVMVLFVSGCVNTRGPAPHQPPIYDPAAHDVGRGLSRGL